MENFDYLCNDMEQYIQIRGQLVDLTTPRVMGILNVTPDSFYEGSRQQTEADIARRADQIVEEGGTMIDVGAFSTRPDAIFVSEEEEMERLRTGLRIVRRCQPQAIVSVDTFRPMVARMAVEEYGADIINDVSEGGVTGIAGKRLTDRDGNGTSEVPAMFEMVARLGVPYVLMSVQPTLADTLISMSMKLQQLRELGVNVKMTRTGDTYPTLKERTAMANRWNADVFISVHLNALPKGRHSNGVEIYIMALPTDKDAMALAKIENAEIAESGSGKKSAKADKRTEMLLAILGNMQQNQKISESTLLAEDLFQSGQKSGLDMKRVAQAPFWVLRGAAMPAVLIETGFITELAEVRRLAQPAYQQRMAEAFAAGIVSFINR